MAHAGQLTVATDGQSHTFVPTDVIKIGRDPTSTVVVNDPVVSRAHGEIRQEGGQWVYRDLNSAGGTRVGEAGVTVKVVDRPLDLHLAAPHGPVVHLTPSFVSSTDQTEVVSAVFGPFEFGRTTIGRDPDNDITVHDLLVSRHHAVIHHTETGLLVQDLSSSNGTFVNGRRIQRAEISSGDILTVGHERFRLDGTELLLVDEGTTVTFGARSIVVETGGGTVLIDDVSFDLPERSLLAIVGPSGSGKSTLLGVLSGLRSPTSGQVLYQNRDLHAEGEELTHRIGFVPQADLLHDGLTVRQSLSYTVQLRLSRDITEAERNRRIDDVLAQLGMSHRAEARIDRLSGGERKRVNVATELLTEPSLLLLDEPASGLDAGLERTLMQLLRDLADAGRTIIVVTHALESLHMCDRIMVLAPGGSPAFVGAPAGVVDRFGHPELIEAFQQLGSVEADWRDPAIARNQLPVAPTDTRPTGRRQIKTALSAKFTAPEPSPKQGMGERLRQLSALSKRFFAVIASDRRNAALLVAQAPILGLLMLAAMPTNELSVPAPTEVRFVSTAGLVLFVVLLGGTWLGANNAIREIAKERALFLRERAAGLSTAAYVLSKALVLGLLTAVQAAVLVAVATAAQGGPASAVLLGWPRGELMVIVALSGLASMSLSLLISAVVGTPDRATTVLPIVLILQFVLSAGGVLPEIVDKPVLRELSSLSSAQWGFAGSASTADLNRLQAFTDQLRDLREVDAADPAPAIEALSAPAEPPRRWAHTATSWSTAAAALVALTVLPLVGAILLLRRRPSVP